MVFVGGSHAGGGGGGDGSGLDSSLEADLREVLLVVKECGFRGWFSRLGSERFMNGE